MASSEPAGMRRGYRPRGRIGSVHTLDEIRESLEAAGANLTLEPPMGAAVRVGRDPNRTRVFFRVQAPLDALARGDLLAVAEAYLEGAVEVHGDFLEVVKVTSWLAPPARVISLVSSTTWSILRVAW